MSDDAGDAQDRDDMARLAGGHDAALNDLMERHGQRLFHYLLRQLPSQSDAEDCAQEAFVRVYIHSAKFRTDAKFSTWLYTIATNLARDVQRRRGRHKEVSLDAENDSDNDSLMERLPGTGLLPDHELIAREQSEQVRQAVQALPEEMRAPLVLFEYENLSQAEIATVLKCTPKAVELRIYRAKKVLKQALAGVQVC